MSLKTNKKIEFSGTVVAYTDDAVLVEIDGEEAWLPRSRCDFDPEYPDRDEDVTVMIPTWLAHVKGLV